MWRTAETTSTPGRVRVILALETSCDDTCAAVVTRDGRDPLQRDLLAGRPRSLRRRRPRDRLAPPSRADRRRRRRRAGAGRACAATTSSWSRSRAGPGWSARCWSAWPPPRRWPPRTSCRWPPVDHLHGHVAASFLGRRAVRAAVPEPGRQRRPHAAGAGQRPRARLRGARPDARRRRRRGVRQGRAAARARLPGRRRRSSGWRATAIRRRSSFPTGARLAGPGLLVRRAEDRAALPRARAGRGRDRAPARRPRRVLPARDRRVAGAPGRARAAADRARAAGDRRRRGGQRRRCASGMAQLGVELRHPAPRAVHRQRGDDRQRRPLRAARCRIPSTSALDVYATGERVLAAR